MKTITPASTAPPGGHYSPGVYSQGILYVSGQLPITPSGEKVLGSIEEQTRQVLQNVLAIVQAAGGQKEHIVKSTIYIAGGDLWGAVNKIYANFFGDHRPARAIVPVPELHYGFLLEMEAVAHIPQ